MTNLTARNILKRIATMNTDKLLQRNTHTHTNTEMYVCILGNSFSAVIIYSFEVHMGFKELPYMDISLFFFFFVCFCKQHTSHFHYITLCLFSGLVQ